MASGGFTAAVRRKYPKAIVYDLTLPIEQYGHIMHPSIPFFSNIGSSIGTRESSDGAQYNPKLEGGPVRIEFTDIINLKDEFEPLSPKNTSTSDFK
jgi:hypothetical protein